jgi:hypothetical protein
VAAGGVSWRSRVLGVALGLAGAVAVLTWVGHDGPDSSPSGPAVTDCDGPLRELVIHYTEGAGPVTGPIFKEFLGQLSADVDVHVVCPDQAAYDDLLTRVGEVKCRLAPALVGHAITGWSRDRWIALDPGRPDSPRRIISPRGEMGADAWPARRGDEAAGRDLAIHLGRGYAAVRSDLFFDGGDFVADGRTVFVAPGVLTRNVHQTLDTRDELLRQLETLVGRRTVLLDGGPDHHAGMFMMTAGRGVAVVGDPVAGRRLWDAMDAGRRAACFPQTPDWSDAAREQFEFVARACQDAGYRVVRMPTVTGTDHRTYLAYVNVIIDDRPEGRMVYMPVYRGADELNLAARGVWEGLGYEVRPIDCTAAMPHFGALRCLVSVLRRG